MCGEFMKILPSLSHVGTCNSCREGKGFCFLACLLAFFILLPVCLCVLEKYVIHQKKKKKNHHMFVLFCTTDWPLYYKLDLKARSQL